MAFEKGKTTLGGATAPAKKPETPERTVGAPAKPGRTAGSPAAPARTAGSPAAPAKKEK